MDENEIQSEFNLAIKELGIQATLIQSVTLLYCGWEADNLGFVARVGTELVWICSNHCSWYLRRDFQELRKKIQEYEQCLQEAKKALSIVEETSDG